jgi:hypothetical protein
MPDKKADKKVKKKSEPRIKRKSSDKKKSTKISTERKTSTKKTWERFVQQSDSRSVLKDAWKAENFQKEYSDKINKLHKKYTQKNTKT